MSYQEAPAPVCEEAEGPIHLTIRPKQKDLGEFTVRRGGQPEEVASLAVYLASENAGYITGQCYLANGGAYFQ